MQFLKPVKNSGQGSMEYMILIGAAVVIGALIIALILNLSSVNKGQADAKSASLTCIKYATIYGQSNCAKIGSAGPSTDISVIWNSKSGFCYACRGSFPTCFADLTNQNPVADASCGSGNNLDY